MNDAHLIRRLHRMGVVLTSVLATNVFAQAPHVTRARWGATPTGDTVWQYTLVNRRGTTVRAINLGAIITNILVRDRDGKLDDVVLGMPDVEGYLTKSPYFGAVAGRYANRIARGKFTLDGKTYTLATNNGPNHLHGGLVGFDKRIWTGRSVQSDSGVGVAFSLTSADGDQGYPGELRVTARYLLTDDDRIIIDYRAVTSKPTIVNLTQHSYFNLAGTKRDDVLGNVLTVSADRYVPIDSTLIPTGELAPVAGTPFDFRKPTAIGARINSKNEQLRRAGGYDHSFVIDRTGPGLVHAAQVFEPTTGRTLDVWTTEPAVQVYTGNFLDGTVAGKGGRKYAYRGAICLETTHFPDTPNHPAFPSVTLRPGAVYASRTIYGFGSLAQSSHTETVGNRIDALAKQALARHVAGISVAVARDGQPVIARGYGMANLEHSVAVTPATVFHIASISKNILAAVVLQLVDQGRLQLDDDVTRYVPEASTLGHRVTVRELLNHTSGIYSFTALPDAADNERRDLSHEQVLALIKGHPFDFQPGTRWRYDNSGFYLAGMVVERVTKQEYGAYVREHLFKPLGMTSASLCDARTVVPHLASGYEVDDGVLVNAAFVSWRLPFAAGAVCATATDLLQWQAALDQGRILSTSSLALMRTATALPDGTTIDYGLGTRLGSVDGHRVLGHTGNGGGFRAVLESFPDDHLTIVVLMNTDDGSPPPVAMATGIARAALGLAEHRVVRDLSVPHEELAAFAGKFSSDDGTVETFARDGNVHYRILGTAIEGILRRQAENVYAIDEDSEIHLVMRGGQVALAMVYTGGLFVDAKYPVM